MISWFQDSSLFFVYIMFILPQTLVEYYIYCQATVHPKWGLTDYPGRHNHKAGIQFCGQCCITKRIADITNKKDIKKSPAACANRTNERRSGTTRNRTGDTRIFSPLLYQLSYGTIINLLLQTTHNCYLRLQRYTKSFNLQTFPSFFIKKTD